MASELEALRRRVAQLEEENATLKSRGAVDVSASIDALQRAFQLRLESSSAFLTPLVLPDVKKRQFFAVACLFFAYPLSLAASAYAVYAVLAARSRAGAAVLILYATWVARDDAPRRCGRRIRALQLSRFSSWLGGYFPIKIRKASADADFDDRSVYLFGYHPHGIISVGCFTQFAFDGSGASKLFPKLRFHCATLAFNFRIPFFRELLLGLGIIEVSAKSIKNALSSGPGAAVVIVPGGAAESLDASPGGEHVLTLRKRNGFFRIALQHGAKLVPVFSFGENDLYGVVSPTGPVRRLQAAALRLFGYAVPVYLGAGSNSATFGSPMPMRRPIITVVGDPIACPRIPEPTQEQIDDLKVQYIERLRLVFDKFAQDQQVLTIDK